MQTSNGAGEPQLNGNAEPLAQSNGVSHKAPSVKLDAVHKDMVRLIGQYLVDFGFKDTVESLMTESGCRLDHPEALRFKRSILKGDWKEAEEALMELQGLLEVPEHVTEMKFLILEQKFLELLEKNDHYNAIDCLRQEISPLNHNVSRVHKLSGLLFLTQPTEIKKMTNWQGSGTESRNVLVDKLVSYLPASVMLPPCRLERLVLQALQHQISVCEYHNSASGPLPVGSESCYSKGKKCDYLSISNSIVNTDCLLTDHKCVKEHFPSTCLQTITEHNDEVLVAAFSHDGKYLATAGKDCSLIIWDVDKETLQLSKKHAFDDHGFTVVDVAWSHDNSKIIACMQDDAAEVIVWDVERGRPICKVNDSPTDSLTSACWYKNDEKFVCGGLRGQFYLCNLEGAVLERWEGVRVQNCAVTEDGKSILASDTHRRIRKYQFEDMTDENILQEDHGIMSFNLDSTGRFALLNVNTQGVHMWDVQSKTLVRKFRGASQGHCTIQSSFGGINENYVASGSEDKKVYIWHRTREEPLVVLSGHQKTVNAVTWNPCVPSMLVSVSDDNSIKVWGPKEKRKLHTPSGGANGQALPPISNLDISSDH